MGTRGDKQMKKMKETKQIKKSEYIFDLWVPNWKLMLIWMILYGYTIIFELDTIRQCVFLALSIILFGWAINYGHWKNTRRIK